MKKLFMSALGLALAFGMYAQNGASGVASFYAPKFEGRRTATGEVFRNGQYTAASNTVKLGTYVKVTNLTNGEVVYVKVNDRMAAHNKRLIDLASIAADDLRFRRAGTARVKVEEVSAEEGRRGVIAQAQQHTAAPTNRL